MKSIRLNSYSDLIDFIKLDFVTTKQAVEVVCKTLSVICIHNKTKEELIKETEAYIENYCLTGKKTERPLFLENLCFDL